MRVIDENTITDAVLEQMSSTPSPRLKEIMACLVRHLHAFAREVDLTPGEWLEGISFLTAVGQTCTPHRQEFILLSDTLGLSALVNALNDKRSAGPCTKSSLLGPFYRRDAPMRKLGESILGHTKGSETVFYGRVANAAGQGIPNALVEIWEADEGGYYDLQKFDPEVMDLRGCLHADSEGRYCLRGVCPLGYLIPMDGPVGDMIRAQRRHGFRPAHVHFMVSAPGYRELVTALYISGDEHLESDTVFGVSESLVVSVNKKDAASPFPNLPSVHFDFRLAAAEKEAATGRVGADPSQILKRGA